MHVSIYNAEFW